MLKTLKYCFLLMTFVSAIAQSPDCNTNSIENSETVSTGNIQEKTSNDIHDLIKDILIDVAEIEALELVVFSMTTIAHELGHAVTAKSLFESRKPIQIHIGTRTPQTTPKLFSLKNMHFYKAMPWTRGLTELNRLFKQDQPSYNNIGLGTVFSAGGLSGAALMYILLSAVTGYCAHRDNKGLSEITLKSFINGSSPFSYILKTENLSHEQKRFLLNATLVMCLSFIYQIFYGCTPYRNFGDGITIWKNIMGVTGTKLKVAQVLSTLGVWGSWIFLIKKYCDARKQLSEKDSDISSVAAISSILLMYMQLIPSE